MSTQRGTTTTRWGARDLDSGGLIDCDTRAEAERYIALALAATSPEEPGPHRQVLQIARRTTYPDGSVHTGPWRDVPPDPRPADLVEWLAGPLATVAHALHGLGPRDRFWSAAVCGVVSDVWHHPGVKPRCKRCTKRLESTHA